MNNKFLIAIFSFISSFAFSQVEDGKFPIHSNIRTEDHLCINDSIPKIVLFEVWYEEKWVTLFKAEIKKCDNTYPLKVLKKDRKFKLTVQAENYETKEVNFSIQAGTTSTYEIGEIVLKKKRKFN